MSDLRLFCCLVIMSVDQSIEKRELKLESDGIRKLSLLYRAIDHPVRLKIIKLLDNQKTISVLEMCVRLGMGKETVSQHLGVLRKAGLAHSSRHSRFQYYSLNYQVLARLKFPPEL